MAFEGRRESAITLRREGDCLNCFSLLIDQFHWNLYLAGNFVEAELLCTSK